MKKAILEITDYTYDGLGIGKVDGFPIFVEHTAVGDRVEVEITKMKKNLAFAKVVKYLSTTTVTPICDYYDECGGCHLMHLDYDEQLRFKTNHVRETIKRIGKIEARINDCVGMDTPYNYRNKLLIPFKENKAGLYKRGTHEIVDISNCYLLDDYSFSIINFLKKYNTLDHVLIRNNSSKTEYMVVLVSKNRLSLSIEELTGKFDKITSVINSINDGKTNKIIKDEYHVLYGEDKYNENLLDVDYEINHRSFFQINHEQTEKLYDLAISAFDLINKTVIDSYAGLGSIGFSFSKKAKKVYAIELNSSAVEKGKEVAKKNGITNVEFICGKAEDHISEYVDRNIDVLITDPPRKGCDQKFLDVVIDSSINEFVYVSCNVSTLARDINYLKDVYECIEITPVDMFPQTYHVECVAKLVRKI